MTGRDSAFAGLYRRPDNEESQKSLVFNYKSNNLNRSNSNLPLVDQKWSPIAPQDDAYGPEGSNRSNNSSLKRCLMCNKDMASEVASTSIKPYQSEKVTPHVKKTKQMAGAPRSVKNAYKKHTSQASSSSRA